MLQNAVPLDAALVQLEEGFWVLPSRPSRVNPAGLLAGSRTLSVLADLRERFDLVLIDSPPLAGLADGLILSSLSDVVVLVVRAGVTKPADLGAATSSLLHNMTPIAGTVVFEESALDDVLLREPRPRVTTALGACAQLTFRRTPLLLIAAWIAGALLMVPIMAQPILVFVLLAGLGAAALAWRSIAFPLGLVGAPDVG